MVKVVIGFSVITFLLVLGVLIWWALVAPNPHKGASLGIGDGILRMGDIDQHPGATKAVAKDPFIVLGERIPTGPIDFALPVASNPIGENHWITVDGESYKTHMHQESDWVNFTTREGLAILMGDHIVQYCKVCGVLRIKPKEGK